MNSIFEYAKAHLRRIWKSRELELASISSSLVDSHHLLITTVHNEEEIIPYFLEYYRRLGFSEFIFINNQSDDRTARLLHAQTGVTIYKANGSYKHSRFGNDWVNHLLCKHGVGKWILYVDADEFLVYPEIEATKISAFTKALEETGKVSLHCLMVDMYAAGKLSECVYSEGQDPLRLCPYFDRDGYFDDLEPNSNTRWIKGGVRCRLFFDNVSDAPALNKIPLVKWSRHFAYLKSSHQIWPLSLNAGSSTPETLTRGALLHFKFLSTFTRKLALEAKRRQHTDEYVAYTNSNSDDLELYDEQHSVRYEDWQTLRGLGLL